MMAALDTVLALNNNLITCIDIYFILTCGGQNCREMVYFLYCSHW